MTSPDDAAADAAFRLPTYEPSMEADSEPDPVEPAPAPAPEPEPEEDDEEEIPEFDPAHRDAFTGLLYVGALTERFELFGHSFTISTPTQTERLQIGQVIEPYQSTVTAEVAYQTAFVAAYLVQIDGRHLVEPILTDAKDTALHERFRWVSDNLRRKVVDEVFDRCLRLDNKVDGALNALGKASA